jgi:uncharacterized membrane protein YebE (DUF533 family)
MTTLDQLIGWVKTQGTQQKDRSGISGWLVGGAVTVAALGCIAWLYYRNWQQSKQLAQLEYDRDVHEQESKRAVVQKALAANEEDASKHRQAIVAAEIEIATIDAAAKLVDDARAKTLDEIDNIKNWRDVDRYLGGGSGTKTIDR